VSVIFSRAPLRISLGGGGTDLPSYYREHTGFVISAAIDKYVYITLHDTFAQEVIVKYSKMEVVASAEDVKHPIVREALKLVQVGTPHLEITSMADIPAGTGLGSSGSFTTALLRALHTMKKNYISRQELAEEACHIEMRLLGEPVGKQDQYMAAFGGITTLEIDRDGSVSVTRLCLGPDLLEALEANTLLFYTGGVRDATSILEKQDKDTKEKANGVVSSLSEIKDIGFEIRDSIVRGNMRRFGELLHIHWQVKKRLSNGITNSRINEWYELARRNGAIGGKISGAGGGGFLMLYCEGEKTQLREALRGAGLRELRFRFDFEGSKVVFDVVSRDGRLAHIRRQEKSSPLSSVVRAAYA